MQSGLSFDGTPDGSPLEISGLEQVVVSGGDSGHSGSAMTGGTGGTGSGLRPDGGSGGAAWAEGGEGGTSRLKDHTLAIFGRGGDGGDALLFGAHGGRGATRCGLPDGLLPGGMGGAGGTLDGAHGVAGGGATAGVDGIVQLDRAGNGGDGGTGVPRGDGGDGGDGGTQTTSKTPQEIGRSSLAGALGFDCVKPNLQEVSGTTIGSVDSQPCPKDAGFFDLVSFSPDPIDYVITIVDVPGFAAVPAIGQTVPAPGPLSPWSHTPIRKIRDLGTMAHSGPLIEGRIEITFTLGSTSVTSSIPVRHEFR